MASESAAAAAAAATPAAPASTTTTALPNTNNITTPGQAQQHYRNLLAGCQEMILKISELEQDRNEHLLVEETLRPLPPQRRAFRLVGQVLVERTVGEVLPTVAANRENVRVNVCVCVCAEFFLAIHLFHSISHLFFASMVLVACAIS
jgi:prefoldin subunit 2